MSEQEGNGLEGIAIVGMAGRFPRAADLDQFWRNLTTGLDCVSYLQDDELDPVMPPELLRDPNFVKARGVLDEPDLFDARFFDISPRQAELMDPQNRLFLECAHQALEDAGIDPERYPGAIGVFGGVTMSSYFLFNLYTNPQRISSAGGYQIALGTDRDYLTTFVSYKLNLRGPSLDVQTACSTSLVATVLACQNLLSYTCDVALAGGVSIKLPQKSGYMYQPGGLDSLQGRCRAFDAGADGSVYGGGVGIVVLKRLEDAVADGDTIHAVILGAALNNDGSAKVGFTAPGIDGQAEVIATAQALAGVDPESIGYVECHGSGTALGDPIEVAALTKAFRAGNPDGERTGYCAIGSVKTNVGHCSAAAGVAGLLKAALALEHRQIPPSLHYERPNPAIDFSKSPFYVADRLIDWEADGTPRRAGVSSFGLGGTNAHVVLQEPPQQEPSGPSRPWQLLLLSAKTETALEAAIGNLAADLEVHPERSLADVAFTLQTGRRIFGHRRMLVCRGAEDACRALAERDPRRLLGAWREAGRRPVAFLLPGVGDHYAGMARGLYEAEPAFREHLDRCAELLRPRLGADLREVIFPGGVGEAEGTGPDLRRMLGRAPQPANEASLRLHRTLFAQPAVFAVEYALAQVWEEWGIRPEALLGYSLGEYTAACLAGVLTLEDALLLVAERARLIDGLPAGAMLTVSLPEERVRPLLGGELDVSAINAPGVCVVSGSEEAVARLRERLDADGVSSRRLPTTHAFHSRSMEPVAPVLDRLARGVRLRPPRIPYVSNVTGTWITQGEATDPGYWVRHLRQPVRFAQGIATLWKSSSRVLLEVGPGFGLSTLVLQQAGDVRGDDEEERLAIPSLRNEHDRQPDEAFLLGALGKLWLAGVDVDWKGFYAHERRLRVRLPTYPFERQRYWIEPGRPALDQRPAPQRQEVVKGALTGGAFEKAREIAPGTRLVLVEDDEIVRRIARLRELEALGAEVVVVGASEAERLAELPKAPVEQPPAARYARPSLRNAYVPPENEREVRVAGFFQELLGVEPVGLYDSFFELGGHSLLGTSLLARVRDLFGVELPLRVVFESPTVAGLVEAIDRETAGGPRAPEILPVPRGGEIPLSYAQQRLWFLDRLMPGNPFYNLSGGVRLSGPLDLAALRWSVHEMVRRHETLRTSFAEVDGRPVQRIAAELEIPTPLVDLTGLPDERREEAVRQTAGARALEPYDLGRPGLLRITLLWLGGGEHALLFGMHHIVSDAWSMGVLVREVAALYAAASQGRPSPLPDLPFQYADFAAWQQSWLSGEVLDEQLRYWRERLARAPALELPADRPRPPVQSFRGATLRVSYPRALAEELAALARRQDVSLFMVLFAAFQTLLCRYTGEDDLVVGSPIANRTHSGLEGLIGFFVNTLVLRTDLSGDPGFPEVVGRVKEVSLGAHSHQDLPFEQLVEELQPRRDLSRNPLFQVMFNLINVPAGRLEASELAMAPLPSPGGTALFDLQAYVTETGEGLDISWEYATDLFERETIERFSRHFETLLAGIAAGLERRLSELPLLTSAELAQLGTWNDTAVAYSADLCAHQLIEAQVRRSPEAVALVDETGERLTYAELNDQADRLAHHLRRRGVGPGTLVAVSLERSAKMVAALLAVWKAGGAYVPLDPSHPAERISYILEDSGARMLLNETDSSGPAGPLEPLGGPEDLAYVIYTSGSTGRPKGVEVRHGGLVNFLASMAREPGLDASDVVLAVTTISFDIAGLELWLPLTVGARVALASRDTAVDGARLAEALASTGATLLQATPATWRLLLAVGWTGSPGLKALCGGEALPSDLAREIAARSGSLWNVYGPTETTVWSALQPVRGDGPVPVGLPIANTTLYLVGRSWELVPVGALGEIWIGGAGLARGYLLRPDLTARRFVPDPFGGASGARLYRTGDLARRLPDGTVEFLGRLDHQVKIRGFRVELGEIEAALAEDPAVREAAVVVLQEAADDQRLVAYLVREPGCDLPDLRQTLLSRLPSYMVPSAFVELEALPLTPSGKVDRKVLPRPDREIGGRESTVLRTPAEVALAGIWAEVLGVGTVGAEDDFFALGGHSLLGTRVVARIRQVLEVDLPLRALFEHPTLAALARAVEREQGRAQGLVIPPLRPRGGDGPAPLSFAQQRLWFMDRLEPGSPFYTLFTAVRLSGDLGIAVLCRALDEIVRRHESLRTAFVEGEQGTLQVVQPARPLDVPLIDLRTLDEDAREVEARRLVAGEAVAPFDLGSGALLRCRLLRLDGREHAVTCAMHHIASDFLSLQIFVQELAVLYDAFSRGEASPLPALPVQYADFAVWQRGWLTGEVLEAEIAWWKERLTGAPSRIELRADRPRSEAPDFRGATRTFELPAPLMETLQAVSRTEGCTLFMALLAAFEVLLHHASGQDDLVVGTPVGYRNWPEIEGAVGLFANTLALRADLGGDPTFRELLARVRRMALGAFAHQHVPFERLVEALRPERSLSHNPLFQVTFNFVAAVPGRPVAPVAKEEAPSLSIAPFVFERETAQFDLSMLLVEGPVGVTGSVQYKTGLFDAGTVGWMLEQFRRILDRVVVEPEVRLGELRQRLARADEERRAGIDRELEEASFQKFKERRRRAVPALT